MGWESAGSGRPLSNVACDEQEIAAIKDLIAHEVHVFYQLVPEQRVIEVQDLV